jgi:molecular chaperone DnaJ
MKDPYKVLGVGRDATDDEIKKAYRELARKYHPDNYVNSPLSDLAQEKMKEINEAYDEIQKDRTSGKSDSENSGSSYGYSSQNVNYSGELIHARDLISNGRYAEADIVLSSIPDGGRQNAEWNFLMGIIKAKRGAYYDAMKLFETARYMDPDNFEYNQAYNDIVNLTKEYGQTYQTFNTSRSGVNDVCSICQGLFCADCCCEWMGGDLIPCC